VVPEEKSFWWWWWWWLVIDGCRVVVSGGSVRFSVVWRRVDYIAGQEMSEE